MLAETVLRWFAGPRKSRSGLIGVGKLFVDGKTLAVDGDVIAG